MPACSAATSAGVPFPATRYFSVSSATRANTAMPSLSDASSIAKRG
jgi:hypothetical protein